MRCDAEGFDGLPSGEQPTPLDRLPYARRVGELIQAPGALERWRARCHEAFLESRQRQALGTAWEVARAEYLSWEVCEAVLGSAPPGDNGELAQNRIISPDQTQTRLVRGRVPHEFGDGHAPYDGGPLPLSSRHVLSLSDCYFVLALIHDSPRRDAGRVNPFPRDYEWAVSRDPAAGNDFDEIAESVFWAAQPTHLTRLEAGDGVTLDECLARVEADLRTGGVLRAPESQPVLVRNWEEGGRTITAWLREFLSAVFRTRASLEQKASARKRGNPGVEEGERQKMVKEYDDYKASGLSQKEYLAKRGNFDGMDAEESLTYLDRCRKHWAKPSAETNGG